MILYTSAKHLSLALALLFLIQFGGIRLALGQIPDETSVAGDATSNRTVSSDPSSDSDSASSTIAPYFHPQEGLSFAEILQRAIESNGELVAARLDIERAKARMRQAGVRPNPMIDFEQSSGRLTGSDGEGETSVGISLPVDLGGKRRRRLELAKAELEAVEAGVAELERRLTAEVLAVYAEALAALREMEITTGLTRLDLKTVVFVQARVNEGETPPLELNLLYAEVERLRSRRLLIEGRLQSALIRLKGLANIPHLEPLRLREDISVWRLREPPGSLESAVAISLRTRPDLRLARLNEEVALAGYRLADAQGTPSITAFTKYAFSRSTFDDTPVGPLRDRDKLVTFGLSVELPVFNRNQGAKAEAATAIIQARRRREYAETRIRAEVASAFARYDASRHAFSTFEQGVVNRSEENLKVIRAVYELGEIRITDLITEQRRLLDSQREFTEAMTERFRALSDLHLAIGTPLAQPSTTNKE